jgi:subtilisin family serine protease
MRKGNHVHTLRLLAALVLLASASWALAKSPELEPLDSEGKRSWIVELSDPPLLRFDGRHAMEASANSLTSTAPHITGTRLDPLSPNVRAYSSYLDDRFDRFLLNTNRVLGESAEVRARYRILSNGAALRLTESQARLLEGLPGVESVRPNEVFHIDTDASADLIGATRIWSGEDGNIPSRGEGIVIGIVDTGINWDHQSFQDPAPDGYRHNNPLGQQLGLCSDAAVLCNNKLIGVYDFTDEGTKGRGSHFHGSHVASIAAGNPVNATVQGVPTQISGIAPRANIVSYKVCREDDPATPDEDEENCLSTHIISALEQAVIDGVDVVNVSLGGGTTSPWIGSPREYLDLRNAGIFAATSASNAGPAPASVENPGLAPWLLAVAAATHTRWSGSTLEDLSGGNTEPPLEFAGAGSTPVSGSANGVGPADIVWAGDYGNALCGTGESEEITSCSAFTGASNPFAPGTFDGKIVVCERGDYGRVEKGFNVMQAGAVGYVLVNSIDEGESVVADNHCLPGIHIGYNRGQELKSWLTSGSGHMATIGPFSGLTYTVGAADMLADFSAQGPNPAVPDLLSPSITAPGVAIVGAGLEGDSLRFASGTSMASPQVAGGGALLLSAEPTLTPSQIQSMMQTTATTKVRNYLGEPANPFEMGSGRVQLAETLKAGLYMHVTGSEFLAANPLSGGEPSTLNLPGLVNSSCTEFCSFNRRVTDRVGGGSWLVTAEKFPAGTNVTISPASFTISSGATQSLQIDIAVEPETVGSWVFGEIKLSSDGLPDQHLTVAVFSNGGELPSRWIINSGSDSGWKDFTLSQLSALPNATFSASDLAKPSGTTGALEEDPTPYQPFDNNRGTMDKWFQVPEGSLRLYAHTPRSNAIDVDLYVGKDLDGDNRVDEGEVICESRSERNIETCDIRRHHAAHFLDDACKHIEICSQRSRNH